MENNTPVETLPSDTSRLVSEETPVDSPLRVVSDLESRLKSLDEEQQEIANHYPEGPQRLRGLAGTGKTILFAKRAAKIHKEHPEWKIAFVFFTRSLYSQIREDKIRQYYADITNGQEPNWNNLEVLHAWGAKDAPGFYRKLAISCGVKPKSVKDIEEEIGRVSPGEGFEYICNGLEQQINKYPILYDAILIDEGQDLPPSFYRLAYHTLAEPKRIYWAYDEAQGIGSLIVPEAAEIFGRNIDGTPVVDLGMGSNNSFYYEGTNIRKASNLNRCYRTPKLLLTTAHAVNMGLLRKGGVLQGVSSQEGWKKLGYEIVEGDFTDASVKEGKQIKVERQHDKSPHPIDQENFEVREGVGEVLTLQNFQNEAQEQAWVAGQVAKDIEQGFSPSDIMITGLRGEREKEYFHGLQKVLSQNGVQSSIVGVDTSPSVFDQPDHVTIANIYRAKGNEAWKVYATRFHYTTRPLEWSKETELHKRNEAFVALTRTRLWCVVTGLEDPIFEELQMAKDSFPFLEFKAFNKNSLKRVTGE